MYTATCHRGFILTMYKQDRIDFVPNASWVLNQTVMITFRWSWLWLNLYLTCWPLVLQLYASSIHKSWILCFMLIIQTMSPQPHNYSYYSSCDPHGNYSWSCMERLQTIIFIIFRYQLSINNSNSVCVTQGCLQVRLWILGIEHGTFQLGTAQPQRYLAPCSFKSP